MINPINQVGYYQQKDESVFPKSVIPSCKKAENAELYSLYE